MTGRLGARVSRIERHRGGVDWNHWDTVPPERWTDPVVFADIMRRWGWVDRYPAGATLRDLTEPDLHTVIARVRAAIAELDAREAAA